MLDGDIVRIVRKDYLHEAVITVKITHYEQWKKSFPFSYSLITTIGILYLHTSLPLFYSAEVGCKKVFKISKHPPPKKAVRFWLRSHLNVPCTLSAPHIFLQPSSQEWKI